MSDEKVVPINKNVASGQAGKDAPKKTVLPQYSLAAYENPETGVAESIGVAMKYGDIEFPAFNVTQQALLAVAQVLNFSESVRMRITQEDGDDFDVALVASRDAIPLVPVADVVMPIGKEVLAEGFDIYFGKLKEIMPEITEEQAKAMWTVTFDHCQGLYGKFLQGMDKAVTKFTDGETPAE